MVGAAPETCRSGTQHHVGHKTAAALTALAGASALGLSSLAASTPHRARLAASRMLEPPAFLSHPKARTPTIARCLGQRTPRDISTCPRRRMLPFVGPSNKRSAA